MPTRGQPRSGRSRTASTHVALLRGINVGGKNMLPMADLAGYFAAGGCTDVRTYIQSGNVVFTASPTTARRVPQFVSKRIAERFGYRIPLVLRSADEFAGVVRASPFPNADPALLAVGFLADEPEPSLATALDPKRSPGDSFSVRGREIYLHIPNGFAKTRLTNAYFDSALATTSTFRNWRTVLKLVEWTAGAG